MTHAQLIALVGILEYYLHCHAAAGQPDNAHHANLGEGSAALNKLLQWSIGEQRFAKQTRRRLGLSMWYCTFLAIGILGSQSELAGACRE